ncbi:DUF1214 domain-containing protein [Croceicoccus sp. Ery15]|uniref:DUF1214 domain-containing protein n=1 Tax=Croceicoccus sp. Ery15 TaxID=1703338 RepID=UPI001E3E8D49|nr:DUF1214 domain-containing protein [Croceicoccus sp. Ery15]
MTMISDAILYDAYVYLLSRALVVRQEQTDLGADGAGYNRVKYNPVGSADFVNPNLDVAYLECWFGVDDNSAALLTVPQVEGRYYTAQIIDEWGEVITNINERNYPLNPSGLFALVTPGSGVAIPDGAVRVELHGQKAKMLARVELQTDSDAAVALQKQFTVTVQGDPDIPGAIDLPGFDNVALIGVEMFDHADALLESAMDVCPLAAQMQAQVRAIALAIADPAERARIDGQLRGKIVPDFLKAAVTTAGKYQSGWLGVLVAGNYGAEYQIRTAANLVGIWANASSEVIYFVGTRDAAGQPLAGDKAYKLSFDPAALPSSVVDGYWSVILVDLPDYRVVPNDLSRFNFNSYSPLETGEDGSLVIHVAPEPPAGVPQANWLPSPKGKGFSLTFRTYVPRDIVKTGEWFPPAPAQA